MFSVAALGALQNVGAASLAGHDAYRHQGPPKQTAKSIPVSTW
jgi:hypothetical protein